MERQNLIERIKQTRDFYKYTDLEGHSDEQLITLWSIINPAKTYQECGQCKGSKLLLGKNCTCFNNKRRNSYL